MSNSRIKTKKPSSANKIIPSHPNNETLDPLDDYQDAPAISHEKKCKAALTSEDMKHLFENEYYRYLPNSKKVGHAVLVKNEAGEKVALQYAIPDAGNPTAPQIMPLSNIQEITRFGLTRYKAETADHTPMYAKRFLTAKMGNSELKETDLDIAYFSPAEDNKEPFWGGKDTKIPLFRNDLSKKDQDKLNKKIGKSEIVMKGGSELIIDHESVWARDANKKRSPDQNQVMGKSAKDAYEAFLNSMTKELSPEMTEVLKRAVGAELRNAFYSNYRPEWLHAEGFSLSPLTKNPQRKDNLGAAPKWANTEMMILERIAKWFALHRPESFISIKPHFEMLLESELIKQINFEVTIKDKENWIKFLQEINPFQKYPLFRKSSDLAQGAAITQHILHGVPPVTAQKIATGGKKVDDTTPSVFALSFLAPAKKNEASKQSVPAEAKVNAKSSSEAMEPVEPVLKKAKTKHVFPTSLDHEKSIVEVITTSHDPNYDEPWLGTHIVYSSGTGLVVSHQGKKYILTNAHCVENAVVVRVRLANDRRKFEATRKCVSYQCDLALFEVHDPEFNAIAQPLQFGKMVELQDKVRTMGFPVGGSEISISKGIVSRIEVRCYAMSGLDMLQVQVDASINHGNSGGPVFCGDKVVGVAFQGERGQCLGYMIPVPVIEHFLKEALNGKEYRGFPVLPLSLQTLENVYLRKYHGMNEHQSGVRITRIDELSDAFRKLKRGDILLEIDSYPISNEGTVDIPGVGNCIDLIHVTHMKFMGDTVKLKVLRKNEKDNSTEILTVDVLLDRVPLESLKVAQEEHDKMPTYFIASGICFVPLTRNYIDGRGAEFEEYYLGEDGHSLINAPKKNPDEEIVVVNDILDCEETEGYESYTNRIIKEINGKKINNIRDVVDAIENNKGDMHHIMTQKDVIVVRNMSQKEHHQLLTRYKIHHDRSEDLLALKKSRHHCDTSLSTDEAMEISTPKDVTFIDTQDSSFSANNFPGYQKYLAKLDELEERYKDFPTEQDVEMDEAFIEEFFGDEQDEPLSSNSSKESSTQDEDFASFSSEEKELMDKNKNVNSKREARLSDFYLVKVDDKHRLFKKRPLEIESNQDVEERASKRFKSL